MRAVSPLNPDLYKLKTLFVRFSGCLTGQNLDQSNNNGQANVQNSSPTVAYPAIKRDYIYLELLKIAQEAVLLGMFETEKEASAMCKFAEMRFQKELEIEQKAMLGSDSNEGGSAQGGASSHDDSGYDSSDGGSGSLDTAHYEKKSLLLNIPMTILRKVESTPQEAPLLQVQRPLLTTCSQYIVQSKSMQSLPSSNNFFQTLLTYMNRIMIIKHAEFINGILLHDLSLLGLNLDTFVQAWLQKMEFIATWEAHRIKVLAILTLLPYMGQECVQKNFAEIGRQIFDRLDSELFCKLNNEKARGHYSPSRFGMAAKLESGRLESGGRNAAAVKIRIVEMQSQRFEEIKREDWLLDFDLMDIFYQKLRDLMANLNIQGVEPLLQILPEDLRLQFNNLVQGISIKYEQQKAEK